MARSLDSPEPARHVTLVTEKRGKPPVADDLRGRDRTHVWHPYAGAPPAVPMFPVRRTEGVYIELEDGRRLIDGMASWWTAIHGYGHPQLHGAVAAQLRDMSHVMFGGLTHRPAIELAERLVDICPEGLTRVFISDSGSVAVEVALKMALQYWRARGASRRTKILSFRHGYHGDTLGAMSVCDPVTGMHSLFSDTLPKQLFAPAPPLGFERETTDDDLAPLSEILQQHGPDLAAVILEPIVQGTGGMRFYAPEFLRQVRKLTARHDCLLIADEIASGFGRTGRLFACEHAGISPDIMCLGKALTGGMMTLAATLTTDTIAQAITNSDPGVLMHGPTFMANPLACAAARASIDLLLEGSPTPWAARVKRIEQTLRDALEPCRTLPAVANVRALGAMGVIELRHPADMAIVQPALVELGVWLRPFGKLLYTMPPYVIEEPELLKLCDAMYAVAAM